MSTLPQTSTRPIDTMSDTTRSQRPPLLSETYIPRTLPSVLGHRDMFFMYVCALFLLTNAVLGASGGAVSLIYLTVGAVIFFVPCVVVAAQLGVLFPHEGSLYNWTYHALGSFWSVFVGLLYWVTGVLALITASDAFVTVLQGLNNAWLPEPWQQGLVILGIIFIATLICLQRTRIAQNIINAIAVAIMISVALIIMGTVVWLLKGHPAQTDFTTASSWSINPGNFFFFGIITLNFIGTSGPLTMAGEFKGASSENEDIRRSIVLRHLRWESLCVFALYFLVSLALLVVRGQAMGNAVVLPFEGFTVVDVSLGKLVGDIAVCGFLLYCFSAAIFYSMISSRILMVASIDRRLPQWFAHLNRERAPKNALIFQSFFAGAIVVIVFLISPYVVKFGGSSANTLLVIYNVLSAALTLVWTLATLFFFINIISLYQRNAQQLKKNRVLPMPILWLSITVGSVASLMTIAGIFFLLMVYVCDIGYGLAHTDKWATDPAALDTLANRYVGRWLAILIDIAVLLDALAVMSAFTATTARGFFAVARAGLLPRILSRQSRHSTPLGGNLLVLIVGLIVIVVTALSQVGRADTVAQGNVFTQFGIMSTVGSLTIEVIYIILAVVAFRFVRENPAWWRWVILVIAVITPLLGIYGSVVPFPQYPSSLAVFIALAGVVVAGVWTFLLTRIRSAQVAKAKEPYAWEGDEATPALY